jgi:hypothetical protein
MTHIRIDDEVNSKMLMACGIGPVLPHGDNYVFEAEIGLHKLVDCPRCAPEPRRIGTPISQLSGRPGAPGFEEFNRIARSWGHQ